MATKPRHACASAAHAGSHSTGRPAAAHAASRPAGAATRKAAFGATALHYVRTPALKATALGAAIALSLPLALGTPSVDLLRVDEAYADQGSQVMEASASMPTALASLHDAVASIDVDALQRSAQAATLVDEALSHEGAPYAYGGTTPGGFDCSGFVQYCFRTALGMEVPRTSGEQAGLGTAVALGDLQAGDLVFWGSGSAAYHVGIALGEGRYIHAAGSGQGVVVDTMDYYCPSFAMRVL